MYYDEEEEEYAKDISNLADRPMTYFDISIDGQEQGRIIFELFSDVVPKTTENFLRICENQGKYKSYKETPFHRIVKGVGVYGGDITRGDGRGGWSIYGQFFEDENFRAKHKIEGLLSMVNKGPNTNNSQFMITTFPCPWLDGKHVVFGRVIKGYDIVRKMELCGDELGKPIKKVIISGCGIHKKLYI